MHLIWTEAVKPYLAKRCGNTRLPLPNIYANIDKIEDFATLDVTKSFPSRRLAGLVEP